MKKYTIASIFFFLLSLHLFSQKIESGNYIGAGIGFGATTYNTGNSKNPFSLGFEYGLSINYDLLNDRGVGLSVRLGFASTNNKYSLSRPYVSGNDTLYDTKKIPVYLNRTYFNVMANRSYLEQGIIFGVGLYGALLAGDGINSIGSYDGKYDAYEMKRTSDGLDYGIALMFSKRLSIFKRDFMSFEAKGEYRLAPYSIDFYEVDKAGRKLVGSSTAQNRISFSAGFTFSFATKE